MRAVWNRREAVNRRQRFRMPKRGTAGAEKRSPVGTDRDWGNGIIMTELVKVAFLGIAGVLLAIQFRAEKPEYAAYIGLAVGIIIFFFCIRQVGAVMAQLEKIKSYLDGADAYLAILLKVVGITYICEFSSGICRDAGYQAVAGQIEVLGKLTVMFAGLPILFAVIEQIQSFM